MRQLTLFAEGFTPIQKRQGLGLQYVGSKEIIAPNIIQEIYKYQPYAEYAFDLFGGGGAMSFAFVASGLNTVYNELKTDMCLIYDYVIDCIRSPRSNFSIFDRTMLEFCSRSEYKSICERYKAKENLTPQELIKYYIYSFNCLGGTYYKNAFKEPFAEAGHSMVFAPYMQTDYKKAIDVFCGYFGDQLGNDRRVVESIYTDFCENPKICALNYYDRRSYFSKVTISMEALAIAQLLHHFEGFSCEDVKMYPKKDICVLIDKYAPNIAKKDYKNSRRSGLSEPRALKDCLQLDSVQQICRLERIERLQELERLESLQHIDALKRLENVAGVEMKTPLTITNKSYADFDFKRIAEDLKVEPNKIIILCDPPYQSAQDVNDKAYHKSGFDTEAFCKWVEQQTAHGFNVFLCEYQNNKPDLFKEIATWEKAYAWQKLAKVEVKSKAVEKLFLAEAKH